VTDLCVFILFFNNSKKTANSGLFKAFFEEIEGQKNKQKASGYFETAPKYEVYTNWVTKCRIGYTGYFLF
jgi:hypothetical protein